MYLAYVTSSLPISYPTNSLSVWYFLLVHNLKIINYAILFVVNISSSNHTIVMTISTPTVSYDTQIRHFSFTVNNQTCV